MTPAARGAATGREEKIKFAAEVAHLLLEHGYPFSGMSAQKIAQQRQIDELQFGVGSE